MLQFWTGVATAEDLSQGNYLICLHLYEAHLDHRVKYTYAILKDTVHEW